MLTCKLAVITTTLKARFAMLLRYPPTVFWWTSSPVGSKVLLVVSSKFQ
jgi:hypothetical protein